MGRRGKAPAHPTLAKIEGHYKEKARTRILPIESISGRPSPSLVCQADELTLQIFNDTCDSMQQMGCLSEQDGPIIETYACNYRELLLCIQSMRKDGIEIESQRGGGKSTVHAVNYHRFLANHMKLLQELALTPSARTRLATPQGPKQSDKVGQLLEKLGGK